MSTQQQQQLPAPPVVPAQIPPMLSARMTAPQQQQQVVAPVHVPLAGQPIAPTAVQAPGGHTVPAVNVAVQQPQNPILNSALYQAMMQQGTDSGVTFDNMANFVITQGRSNVHYRAPNDSQELQKFFNKC